MVNKLQLYFHTLRYLKCVQIYSRLLLKFRIKKIASGAMPILRPNHGAWIMPARRRPSLLEPQLCRFLNEKSSIATRTIWNDASKEKLWLYNLHYFDDLNSHVASERSAWHRDLILRWIEENPPANGVGWEPYPLSLRIVNWIKWNYSGNTLEDEWLSSLAIQARFLSRHLEWHLLGNHLFVNAKALVFAGLFFKGEEAERWLNVGLEILKREIPEQILADGGHFERSPMYHALLLEDMLDLINLTNTHKESLPIRWRSFISSWSDQAANMYRWLGMMSHSDGEISFFNDAAFGIAPTPTELESYGQRLGAFETTKPVDGIYHLSESGYIRVQQDDMVALLDAALIGPDYIPGHAHADTLSFELSLFGRRVLVNSGTSCYGNSKERLRQRGTAAHNTVLIDGQNSSEVWSGFRVARRARPVELSLSSYENRIRICCGHDGYQRLAGKPKHLRLWSFGKNELIVEDRISGVFDHAEARFYLHPSVKIIEESTRPIKDATMELELPQGQRIQLSVEGAVLSKQDATWHSEFGLSERNFCLVANANKSVIRTQFKWGHAA